MQERPKYTPRGYQTYILDRISELKESNLLLELDCGLGKRFVTHQLVAKRFPDLKFIIVVHSSSSLAETMDYLRGEYGGLDEDLGELSSRVPSRKRPYVLKEKRIVVSTPQVLAGMAKKDLSLFETFDAILINEVDTLVRRTGGRTALVFPWPSILSLLGDKWLIGMSGTLRDDHAVFNKEQLEIRDELNTLKEHISEAELISMEDLYGTDVENYLEPTFLTIGTVMDAKIRSISSVLDELIRSTRAEIMAELAEGGHLDLVEGDARRVHMVTNSGKSTMINSVTNAELDVGDYPFTTPIPTPAMLTLEDINIQLVEIPGLFDGFRNSGIGRQALAVARNTDCIALIIDLSQDIDMQMNIILRELDGARIRLNREQSAVRIERVGLGGHMIYGAQNYQGDIEEVKEYLRARRISNIIVRFQKPATFDQLVDAMDASVAYVRALVIATKGDVAGSEERYAELTEKYGTRFEIIPISAETRENLDGMQWALYHHLDILRVYTKIPGKKRENRPIVLPEGAIVEDAAAKVHKELFVERFRAAVIYRANDKIKRRQVGLNYPLEDGDVLQLMSR